MLCRVCRASEELKETGELIVFDERSSEVIMLNEVGACVWELIDGVRTVGDIVDFVLEARQEQGDRSVIERDIVSFLRHLGDRGTVRQAG